MRSAHGTTQAAHRPRGHHARLAAGERFMAVAFHEQASHAIQDTPEMVASHYGQFLPQDMAALAAKILNRVWEAA